MSEVPERLGGREPSKHPAGGEASKRPRDWMPRQARDGWNRTPRLIRDGLPAIIAVAVAFLYPSILPSLRDLPTIGEYFPSMDVAVVMIAFTMMAVGLNIV